MLMAAVGVSLRENRYKYFVFTVARTEVLIPQPFYFHVSFYREIGLVSVNLTRQILAFSALRPHKKSRYHHSIHLSKRSVTASLGNPWFRK
jgi:hypothetical protein